MYCFASEIHASVIESVAHCPRTLGAAHIVQETAMVERDGNLSEAAVLRVSVSVIFQQKTYFLYPLMDASIMSVKIAEYAKFI